MRSKSLQAELRSCSDLFLLLLVSAKHVLALSSVVKTWWTAVPNWNSKLHSRNLGKLCASSQIEPENRWLLRSPPDPCPEKNNLFCEKGASLRAHNVRLLLHLHLDFVTIPLSSSQAARSNPYAAKRAYDASRPLGAVVGGVTLSVNPTAIKRPKNISSLTGTSGRA